jgi:hypothetical protein
MQINEIIEEIQTLQARIITEEARVTPMPVTQQSQLVVRHLREAREHLAGAKVCLRLAKVEAERNSSKKP